MEVICSCPNLNSCKTVIKHTFFTTYSTKICFAVVTHVVKRHKEHNWIALHSAYKM